MPGAAARAGIVVALLPALLIPGTAWATPGSDAAGAEAASSVEETAPAPEETAAEAEGIPEPASSDADAPDADERDDDAPQRDDAGQAQPASDEDASSPDAGAAKPDADERAPGSFDAALGIYSVSSSAQVRSVQLGGAGTDAVVSAVGDGSDGLAIAPDGASAYAVSRTGNAYTVQRLSGGQRGVEQSVTSPAIDGSIGAPIAGAISRDGKTYYFGALPADGSEAALDLFAFDIASGQWIGRVSHVRIPNGGDIAQGDIEFDSDGHLLLLVSDGAVASSVLARLESVPSTASDDVLAAAALSTPESTPGSPWNGIAFDAEGALWMQRAITADTSGDGLAHTILAQVDPATGAVTRSEDKPSEAGSSEVGIDLASFAAAPVAYSNPDSIVVSKNVVGRAKPSDQFTITSGPLGSFTEYTATTTGTKTGIQAETAGPRPYGPSGSGTISETGASGTNLADYTITYGCTWNASGKVWIPAGTPMKFDARTNRATADLRNFSEYGGLNCVITNTPKGTAEAPPKLILQKDVKGRIGPGDQFALEITGTGTTPLASAVTTGSLTGIQAESAGPVTVSPGLEYTISESAGNSGTDLKKYSTQVACNWSDGDEFRRGSLSAGSNGKTQLKLPPIPADRSGDTLTCTLVNSTSAVISGALDCSPNTVYGTIRNTTARTAGTQEFTADAQGKITATTPYAYSFTYYAGTTSAPPFNGLGINQDGTLAYTMRAATGSSQVEIHAWTPTGATTKTANGPAIKGQLVGGAIDPTTDVYYFGGYEVVRVGSTYQSILHVYGYTPGASGGSYWQALDVAIPEPVAAGAVINGDFTFDSAGNLYLVWSPNTANDNSVLARVEAQKVPASAPGGVITPVSKTNISSTLAGSSPYNGITFDGNGNLWVSWADGVQRLDPATGDALPQALKNSTVIDLASCGLPPTMKLQKDIVDRKAPSDQFTIGIFADGKSGTQQEVQSATTSGSELGVQGPKAGPMVARVGQQYTIREVGAGSPVAALSNYITAYECRWNDEDTVFDSGVLSGATERSAKLKPIPAGKGGQELTCTFTNKTVEAAQIIARKTIVDADGENPEPGAGWQITTTKVSGSTGTAVSAPAARTTGVDGFVPDPWALTIPKSSDSAVVKIEETPQDGYEFRSGECVITPYFGDPVTVQMTGPSITLGSGANIRTIGANDRVVCGFVNQATLVPTTVTWQKVDAGSPANHLAGSTWLLTGTDVPANTVVVDCVAQAADGCPEGPYLDTDPRAGYFSIGDLALGAFTLTEHEAPEGYVLDRTPHEFSLTRSAPDYGFEQAFVNRMTEVPAIPLTGGLSTDALLVASGVLAALAMAAAVWWQVRRRDSAATPSA
ncbi:hypothetical protein D3248_15415 [Leucobacter zeae]|nr:hypothetical protein [Leucobacter zeae]